MSKTKTALLTDRGVLSVSGDDAQTFLQGLVTSNVEVLTIGQACHAALLTPQGKILFDFFIVRTDDGYLLDVDRDKAAELAKRLGFYKLRAKVDVADLGNDMDVTATWCGDTSADWVDISSALAAAGFEEAVTTRSQPPAFFIDPRLKFLGLRNIVAPGPPSATASVVDYHAHRIAHGVPEGGKDFAFGGAFPHEANMDVLNGVDFEKGCYVGQEVVSRMHHKSKVRKRIVPVSAETALPDSGAEIRAGKALIGTLGSTSGNKGLALIRLDRAAEAIENGDAILAGDVAIDLNQPDWASFNVPQTQE